MTGGLAATFITTPTVKKVDGTTTFTQSVQSKNGTIARLEDVVSHNSDATAHQPILDTINSIISTLGQGGIIASNFNATASYVKFSNGLILQFGNAAANATSITFPVAFTNNQYFLQQL